MKEGETDLSLLSEYHPRLLFGRSKVMEEIRAIIDQVAKSDVTVIIRGESGTGKELVARAIFQYSLRRDRPFVKVLCAAIPEGLLESELFGYEKGSFTGAYRRKPGKFEFANHGTIFLDEIGDLPLSLQAKLLQVLQDGEFTRLGGQEVKVDVRIVAATNKDLERAVSEGVFREDLFYRLNVVSIHLPALRQRKEDIPILTDFFLNRYNLQFNKKYQKISEETLGLFQEYDWPGNVRELENVIKRIVILESEVAAQKHIGDWKKGWRQISPQDNRLPTDGVAGKASLPDSADVPPLSSGTSSGEPSEAHPLNLKKIAKEASRRAEGAIIRSVLDQTRWNRKQAAKILGISYKALLYKIRDCRLDHSP